MKLRAVLHRAPLLALGVLFACGSDGPTGPSNGPPAHLVPVTATTITAPVGTAVSGGVVVKVTDASGRPVLGASVGFAVTAGNGTVGPRVAVTDSSGLATTVWLLGTVVGANTLSASVNGLPAVTFSATGSGGPVTAITLSPLTSRLLPPTDSVKITAQSLDSFGNVTSPAPTFVVRDPSLLSVDATGLVHVLRRGGSTYVVATAGGKTDSVLVTVLAVGQSLCSGLATPLEMAVGQVVTDLSGVGACVHASTAGAEYALVPYFNSPIVSASINLTVTGTGVVPLSLPSAAIMPSPTRTLPTPAYTPDYAFESRIRATERREAPALVPNARAWYAGRTAARRSAAAAVAPTPAIGDLLHLNANALDFCTSPDIRVGRVAAITDKAIIVADTANPIGGFTDEEYRSIGVTFDTLVDPVDRAAFGTPSDIDNNGHVILFFTRAVNELTGAGSSTVTLGLFYQRDLFPKTATPPLTGVACPGSNVAEMFYLMVPDTGGVVNGNRRTKSFVVTVTNGTVAHEYQHLINTSRRMYVTGSSTSTEERWLDEGLAHVAEELNFFKAAGKSSRNNLDAAVYTDPLVNAAFSTFMLNNVNRYKVYLPRTESQAPIGSDIDDDDLATRGAIWDFLRYAGDHRPAGQENAFWFSLVNSGLTGTANLTAALGTTTPNVLRDWAISVFVDDNVAALDPRFQQPSWNLRSVVTNNGTSLAFPLFTRTLTDNLQTNLTLAANGVSFLRFAVPNGGDALLTVNTNGQPAPSTVMLAVVRVK